jgi:8-oxo-dGTP pyrophosphatase MutT (NUDIX family)
MKEVSAGGVVYRNNPQGENPQLLMIEDRYSKVSLPKGKQEQGETLEETALREIKEETGIDGRIIEAIEKIHYQYYHPVHGLIDKEVHYFLVEALTEQLTPQIEEINKVQWMDHEEAWELQINNGYSNNYSVFDKAFTSLGLQKGTRS